MIKSERHIIRADSYNFKECARVTRLSKNLYNAGLYAVRQKFIKDKVFLNYNALDKEFKETDNVDYRALPAKISQQVLKQVEQNFKSFFGSLKSAKTKGKIKRIPQYLNKEGHNVTIYTSQAISKKAIKGGLIHLSKTDIEIKTKVEWEYLQQVRVVPKGNHFVIEVLYKTPDVPELPDNGRYCSIDLGVNNLMTVGSNVLEPIIISGKRLKSINQFYNKQKAKYQSKLGEKQWTSKRIQSLTLKRNNRVSDYLHKSSRIIVNHLVSNQINTLVIGQNIGWKQEIKIGRVNNQKFVNIPFTRLIDMLKYKCGEKGIRVITTEENYTSKCSFLDSETPQKRKTYQGKRVHRGLFRSGTGRMINADLNGALNILAKVIGKFRYDPIVACSTPVRINV